MALQGLSNADDEWVGTAEQEVLTVTSTESRYAGRGRQACRRRGTSRGQYRCVGSTCRFKRDWWGASSRAQELRSAPRHGAEVHPRVCAVPASETSSVSQDALHLEGCPALTCTVATHRSHSCSITSVQSDTRHSGRCSVGLQGRCCGLARGGRGSLPGLPRHHHPGLR